VSSTTVIIAAGHNRRVRVQVVDPSAYTPPYDHSLCAALARAGAEVELVTSRFPYGPVPRPEGYRVSELFYRIATSRAAGDRPSAPSRLRRAFKLAEHVPDMLRYRRYARSADLVHFQWLPVQQLDRHLLPRVRPRVMTAHDVLPREPAAGQLDATRQLLHAMDAVVVHSEHGRTRLTGELGVPPERVSVITMGAFDYLTRLPDERPLPDELARVAGPVVLCFGLIRPYKGVDVLIEAFREVEGAELWIVGMPRMPLAPLEDAARSVAGVRLVPRFVPDPEVPAYFRRADVVVLPYREIDQSAVLYTALAFGKPLVLSAVGGFVELAERHGAARLVPPGDASALARALSELLADAAERERLAAAAARVAREEYSWDRVAGETLALYHRLLGR
jgi:glycosyltransferase involved in cell wall biosynthesis